MSTKDVCRATRKDGVACSLPAVTCAGQQSRYCFAHAPEYASARAAGGRARANRERLFKRLPQQEREALALLATVLQHASTGRTTPLQGRLARCMVDLLKGGRGADTADLIRRLDALEERLAAVEWWLAEGVPP